MNNRKENIEKLSALIRGDISLDHFAPRKIFRFTKYKNGICCDKEQRFISNSRLEEMRNKNPNAIFIIRKII